MDRYTLDKDKNPVLLEDGQYETKEQRKKNHLVARAELPDGKVVSTVFLSLDHNFGFTGDKTPILFETMVFGSLYDFTELDFKRYPTCDEAEKGHKKMVNKWRRKMEKHD